MILTNSLQVLKLMNMRFTFHSQDFFALLAPLRDIRITLALAFICLVPTFILAQNKYGLRPIQYDAYQASLNASPGKELVNLEKFVPGILLDIRYATTNNFTSQRIYNLARAYARRPVAESLKRAQAEFNTLGVGIKIHDAYRPYKATVMFYETYHDTTYVASPYRGSKHNRGCAIDMTIVDLKTEFVGGRHSRRIRKITAMESGLDPATVQE